MMNEPRYPYIIVRLVGDYDALLRTCMLWLEVE
jgi:hypothetical protein